MEVSLWGFAIGKNLLKIADSLFQLVPIQLEHAIVNTASAAPFGSRTPTHIGGGGKQLIIMHGFCYPYCSIGIGIGGGIFSLVAHDTGGKEIIAQEQLSDRREQLTFDLCF